MASPVHAENSLSSKVNGVESESGLALLARLGTRPSLANLDPCLFPEGPEAGDIIEVSGNRNCGKSSLCLRLVVTVLLPQIWKGVNVGGCSGGVIYVDSDLHFSILHLENMMQRRVKNILKTCKSIMKKKKMGYDVDERLIENDVEIQELLHFDKKSFKIEVDKLVRESLKSFIYLKCTGSSQFAITLLSINELILNKANVSLIVIDSISSFYWYDRSYRAETWYKLEQYYNRIFKVFHGHIKKHKLVLISTRQSLFQKKSAQEEYHNQTEEEVSEGVSEYQYMGREWGSIVTFRISLSMLSTDDLSLSQSNRHPGFETSGENISDDLKASEKVSSDKKMFDNTVMLDNDRQMYSAEVTKNGKKTKLVFTVHEDGLKWKMPP